MKITKNKVYLFCTICFKVVIKSTALVKKKKKITGGFECQHEVCSPLAAHGEGRGCGGKRK
jgi:hypothetical protein